MTRSPATSSKQQPALGYASVPTTAALDGPEADAQRKTIERGCRRLGLDLVDVVRDHEPDGLRSERRPGLVYALKRIDAGEATCLIVSDLERLSRDVGELSTVLDRLDGRRLVALDLDLDTDTPAGSLAVARRPGVRATGVEAPVAKAPPTIPVEVFGAPPVEAVEPPPIDPAAEPRSGEAMRALGYASVPAGSGQGVTEALAAQGREIERTCKRLKLELVEIVREREPRGGKALDRAGVSYLIERLAAGDASCVVVTGLNRLSGSVSELGSLVEWMEKSKVRLVAVELDLDTFSPGGQTAARALTSVAQWEHERLSERTRKGLAAARAKRRERGGASEPDWTSVRKRVALMRADGMTLQAIADVLNDEGVPTPRGGAKWRPSSVQTAAGYKRKSRPRSAADLPKAQPRAGRPGSGANPPAERK